MCQIIIIINFIIFIIFKHFIDVNHWSICFMFYLFLPSDWAIKWINSGFSVCYWKIIFQSTFVSKNTTLICHVVTLKWIPVWFEPFIPNLIQLLCFLLFAFASWFSWHHTRLAQPRAHSQLRFHLHLLLLLLLVWRSCLVLLSLPFLSIFTCCVLVLCGAVRRAVSSTPPGRKVCKPQATICLCLVFSLHYSLFIPFNLSCSYFSFFIYYFLSPSPSDRRSRTEFLLYI